MSYMTDQHCATDDCQGVPFFGETMSPGFCDTCHVRRCDDLADIFRADLEQLMPGCEVEVRGTRTGYVGSAKHRETGRSLTVRLEGSDWTVSTVGSSTVGSTAYGFDSAVVHAYRHDLDFTSEHGPGSAHDYAQVSS